VRKITKGNEPASFAEWCRDKPPEQNMNDRFKQLHRDERWDIIHDLSRSCAAEQYFLCCYCCGDISDGSFRMNEHVKARKTYPELSLDYGNIAASCKNRNQCDKAHGYKELPLTPFMDECETELKFYISGRVKGLTPRAEETIRVLNLGDNEINNKTLVAKRKQLSLELLYEQGLYPDDPIDDEALLNDVISDLLSPVDGKLKPFAPVVANILRGWIEGNPIC
jgi:uncharacterized protein (TIGR02646 family)